MKKSLFLTIALLCAVAQGAWATDYNVSNETELRGAIENGANITLSGRKLYKDGDWNTLCLPFDVSEDYMKNSDHPLHGATIMELDTDGWYDGSGNRYDEEAEGRHHTSFADDGTLYLYFKTATEIDARHPYIVKWTTTDDAITSPVFNNTTIEASIPKTDKSTDGKVSFIGNFDPVTLTGGDKSVLYLGSGNQLYYPSADRTMNSFRGYFHVDLSEAPAGVRAFVLNFGEEGETTGIISTTNFTDYTDKAGAGWYDLQGRKLSGKPTEKGIYIYNGKKRVIK